MHKKRSAFSLVEMLMALLVASLLLAALAPVMTKRMQENITVAGTMGNGRAPAAMRCYTYNDTNPTVKMSLDDVWYANFIIASAGGGGGGASKESEEDFYTYISANDTTSKSHSPIVIDDDIITDGIDIALVGGGGGGGGAAAYGKTSVTPANKTEPGKATGPAKTVGCPSGSTVDKNNVNCVYTVTNDLATWSKANTECSKITSGNVSAGNWKLPSRASITENWNNANPGGLTEGAGYWSNDIYCKDSSSNYCANTCGGRSAHYRVWWNSSSWSMGWFCDTDNRNYRCVLPTTTTVTVDTMVNYIENTALAELKTFSAAAGGGGAGFTSLKNTNGEAYSYFQEAVRNNIGGEINITAGGGGTSGLSKTSKMTTTGTTGATNGTDGVESCVSVTNSSKNNIVYKVCAKGGIKGNGVTNILNVSNTAVSTDAAEEQISNGCYYTYKGITKAFNCTGGQKGSNGTSSYKSNSTAARDLIIYPAFNTASLATMGGTGLNIPSLTISGNTVSAGTGTYGDGGKGGGTSIAIDTSGTITYAYTDLNYSPTAGKPGFGRLIYKKRYSAAGGGGGGGGAVAQLMKIYVGKKSECTFTLGKGGSGGNAAVSKGGMGEKGLDGSDSVVNCTTLSAPYTVNGGKGGSGGISATTSNKNVTGGEGGEGAQISDANIFKINPDNRILKNGQKGETNTFKGIYFPGGRGGTSGTGTAGGCGALSNSSDGHCTFEESILPTGAMLTGKGFSDYNEIIHPVEKSLLTNPPSYGTAGAGGGGGGWYKNAGGGKGGDGMGGYVCVYWDNSDIN